MGCPEHKESGMPNHQAPNQDELELDRREREDLLAELTEISRSLDDLPDDAYTARIDLHERRREIREMLRGDRPAAEPMDQELPDDDPVRLVEVEPAWADDSRRDPRFPT